MTGPGAGSGQSSGTGSLPFTGSGGDAPLFGLGSLVVGGSLWIAARRRRTVRS